MPEKQMTLFNEIELGLRHESQTQSALSEWSISRRAVLEQCPRKYYDEYYGANSKTAKTEPHQEKLRFLKKLKNRHLRTGEILHLVIRTYFKQQCEGEVWSLERVLSWAQKLFHEDLAYSRQYQHGTPHLTGDRCPALLLEFYYGDENAEALWAESEERLLMALRNFVTSPDLARFRDGGGRADALVEKWIHTKEAPFTLKGKVDLAYPDGERVVLVDWKIGNAGSSDDSLQLLSYAWWAMEAFKCTPDRITLHQVHLADHLVSSFEVSEKDMMRAKARILQDLEWMQALDDYGRDGVAAAFTPCAQLKVCALCPFQEICPKE